MYPAYRIHSIGNRSREAHGYGVSPVQHSDAEPASHFHPECSLYPRGRDPGALRTTGALPDLLRDLM